MAKTKPGFLERHGLKLMTALFLIIAGVVAWRMDLPKKMASHKVTNPALAIKESKAYYYIMDPMLVNVSKANEYNRYFKVRPVLVTDDIQFYDKLKNYSPMIRNTLLSLYNKETVGSLLAENGFDSLRKKSLEQLHRASGKAGLSSIKTVMFNEYVVQ